MVKNGIQGKEKILKNLQNVMKAVGKKYSIRVGIIGDKAAQTHDKKSGMTNAQIGAIHEFGATIQVTEKMRAYLHSVGIHLKKDTTQISIPARSFLRAVLLDKNIKLKILEAAGLSDASRDNQLNIGYALLKTMEGNTDFMESVSKIIGDKALEFVQTAFIVGGYPDKWQPITEFTKKHRINAPDSEPLNDTTKLYKSITAEVKEVS